MRLDNNVCDNCHDERPYAELKYAKSEFSLGRPQILCPRCYLERTKRFVLIHILIIIAALLLVAGGIVMYILTLPLGNFALTVISFGLIGGGTGALISGVVTFFRTNSLRKFAKKVLSEIATVTVEHID